MKLFEELSDAEITFHVSIIFVTIMVGFQLSILGIIDLKSVYWQALLIILLLYTLGLVRSRVKRWFE